MNCYTFILFLIPISATCQFDKVFDNEREYFFSNKVQTSEQSNSYNYCVQMTDSLLTITQQPDKHVLVSGINCALKTYNEELVHKLLSLMDANKYTLSKYSIENIESSYPKFLAEFYHLTIPAKQVINNHELGEKLAQIFIDDQTCRGGPSSLYKQKFEELNYEVVVDHFKTMEEVDSINTMKLDQILDDKETLNLDEIGSWGITAIFAVAQHSSELTKYKDLMDTLFTNGDLDASTYATYIDRYNLRTNKPQIYGSQWSCESILEMEDIANVNKRRMTMGMISIERYSILFGDVWQTFLSDCREAKGE